MVERARQNGLEQGTRVALPEPADDELVQPNEGALAGVVSHRDHHGDRLRSEAARYERERLCRGLVKPVSVVHDPREWRLVRHIREQAENGHADEEPVRRVATALSERGAERVALRARQAVDPIREGRAELVQTRVGELHLGLDTRSPGDAESRRTAGEMVQQRCLPDPSLAPKNENPALPRSHAREQIVEEIALSLPSAQPGLHDLSKRQNSMLFAAESGVKPGNRPGTSTGATGRRDRQACRHQAKR